MNTSILLLVLYVAIAIVAFLLLREFWAWYFKTNESLSNQREMIRLLKKIAGEEESSKSDKE